MVSPQQNVNQGKGSPSDSDSVSVAHVTPKLADHFLGCSKLGRYLTVANGSRFVITDDFKTSAISSVAAAVASIYSIDALVAQAALLPLGDKGNKLPGNKTDEYERLFTLIEEQALSDTVKSSARAIRQAGFRDAEIRAIEAELGDKLNPARIRYREFLEVVRQVMDGKINASSFVEEFQDFTQNIAGKLDFGIYSFCLDRLFGSEKVPMKVKKLLVVELISYPPAVQRELLTNILIFKGQNRELIEFVRTVIATELGHKNAVEIELLEAFKMNRVSMNEIASQLNSR